MKLRSVLERHDSFSPPGYLADNIGDGYLLDRHQTYNHIRTLFLNFGFRFTKDDFCHYRALPFAALPHFLKKKRVVYLDNVSVLRQVSQTLPPSTSIQQVPTVTMNWTLHEQSHCIYSQIYDDLMGEKRSSKAQPIELKVVMAEAFASTVEHVGIVHCRNVWDRHFYSLNSLIPPRPDDLSLVRASIDSFGFETTFQLVFYGWLLFQFHWNRPSKRDFTRITRLAGVPSSTLARRLVNSAMPENENNDYFRLVVNPFFFRMFHASQKGPFSLVNFNPLDRIESNPDYRQLISSLSRSVATGTISLW